MERIKNKMMNMGKNTKIKKNIIKVSLMILILAIFIMIFAFSNQNAEKSTQLSRKVTEKLTENIKEIQNLDENEKQDVLLKIEVVIRKMAHFSIYMLAGMVIMILMSIYPIKLKNKILCSFTLGVIYAVLDEVHQLFISGRTAKVGDVLIDACGVAIGIGLILMIQWIMNKIKRNEKKEIQD